MNSLSQLTRRLARIRLAPALFGVLVALAGTSTAVAQGNTVAPATRPTTPPASPQSKPAVPPPAATPPAKDGAGQPAPAQPSDGGATEVEFVVLNTTMGDIVLELDKTHAPISVANFLKYVDKGFYDGTVFHRVVGSFVVQGGGFDTNLEQKATDAPIKNEWKNGLKNLRGTVAMARTAEADSATSQFYFNVKDNDALDRPGGGGAAYAVFGRVAKGMDVVDKIRAVPTGVKSVKARRGTQLVDTDMPDVPVTNVTITKAKRVTKDEAKKIIES